MSRSRRCDLLCLEFGRGGVALGETLISRSADVMSGRPVFAGTRVPVQTLFDYIEGGDRLDDFLGDFPTVTRAQALGLLARMRDLAIAGG
jgi:uncharacterized protein (DUF433 family)